MLPRQKSSKAENTKLYLSPLCAVVPRTWITIDNTMSGSLKTRDDSTLHCLEVRRSYLTIYIYPVYIKLNKEIRNNQQHEHLTVKSASKFL